MYIFCLGKYFAGNHETKKGTTKHSVDTFVVLGKKSAQTEITPFDTLVTTARTYSLKKLSSLVVGIPWYFRTYRVAVNEIYILCAYFVVFYPINTSFSCILRKWNILHRCTPDQYVMHMILIYTKIVKMVYTLEIR